MVSPEVLKLRIGYSHLLLNFTPPLSWSGEQFLMALSCPVGEGAIKPTSALSRQRRQRRRRREGGTRDPGQRRCWKQRKEKEEKRPIAREKSPAGRFPPCRSWLSDHRVNRIHGIRLRIMFTRSNLRTSPSSIEKLSALSDVIKPWENCGERDREEEKQLRNLM